MAMLIRCSECQVIAQPLDWRCTVCGGVLDFEALPPFIASDIDMTDTTLWRYRKWLPLEKKVSLGEGMTPLVETVVNGFAIRAKLEYLNPTGSYKDRGTATIINHILGYDAPEVIDDSSGNAGASLAAYASAAGLRSRIFVPKAGSPTKKALIRAFGGELVEVDGAQHAKTDACHLAAASTTYASHAWSPYFLLGQITAGFEIWEQTLPDWPNVIVTPIGHGLLFLGIAQAFQILLQAKLIAQVPHMVAVQSAQIDPVVQAYEQKLETPQRVTEKARTIADGIMVDRPVRGKAIMHAIRQTDGMAVRVEETQIQQAQDALAKRGLIAEPTSAVTVAALPQIMAHYGADSRVVCCLTGNALKNVGR